MFGGADQSRLKSRGGDHTPPSLKPPVRMDIIHLKLLCRHHYFKKHYLKNITMHVFPCSANKLYFSLVTMKKRYLLLLYSVSKCKLCLCFSGGEAAAKTCFWTTPGGEAKRTHAAISHEHLIQGKHAQLSPTGTQSLYYISVRSKRNMILKTKPSIINQ